MKPTSALRTTVPAPTLAGIRCEQELQNAIKSGALFVVHQPIIRLSTGAMIGAETLVRWDHPVRGILLPESFMPLSEASGLIVPIGEFVLEQACNQLRTWQMQPATQRNFVSVDVSAMQLAQGDFVRVVRECVAEYGVPPQRLQLEITETMALAERAVVVKRLGALQRLGVRIVLDDFGCGYMSLAHLARLDVDGLKINRAFTRLLPENHKAATVVSAMIYLADRLGLSVIVEGVETEQQAQWLRRFGEISVQGILYARPDAAPAY